MDESMSKEVCQSLITWLHTVCAGNTSAGSVSSRTNAEMCDGVAICQALVRISPETFTKLQPKVKTDVGNNWRLKVSNLKKVNEAMMVYLQDSLNLHILEVVKPDLMRLGETNDLVELGKLLRLVLVCAVNCDQKQEYITQIMDMEESVQRCIMLAIEPLEEAPGGGSSNIFPSFDGKSEVQRLNDAKEVLAQKCHILDAQVTTLQEERLNLTTECRSLTKQLREREERDRFAEAENKSNRSPAENRRQIDQLNEEIFKVETMRDDYHANVIEQDRQIVTLQEKVVELQKVAEANSRLKDEIDALKESADKVKALEVQVISYKKKLEDYADAKRQLKQLEEKNVQYLRQTLQYEEELKKHSVWRSQSEMYKAESADLQLRLDEEVGRVDQLTFQRNNIETKLEVLAKEKERLVQERDILREENEELRAVGTNGSADGNEAMARELTPTEMKERLRFLESENNSLRSTKQELDAKGALLEDRTNRVERLTEQNRAINQRVLALEAQLEDMQQQQQKGGGMTSLASLQEALTAKEQEVVEMQAKYNRYLKKVDEVATTLDAANAKSNGATAQTTQAAAQGKPSTSAATANSNCMNVMTEMESRLMSSAFYKLGLRCHHEAVDERLAMLSAGQGQSFLSRQRQPVPRRQAGTMPTNNAISISSASVGSATSMPFRSK